MKSRAYIQRRTNTESADPLIAPAKVPSSNLQHEQPQIQAHDFSHVDLFSHAPQRAPIQTKLTVGAPNDQYEQEADRVADQVLSMPDTAAQQPVQREGMEDDELQMKPIATIQREETEDDELQMKPASTEVMTAATPLETQLSGSKGGGSSLPDEVRNFMEPRFGADFSQVRVHTDTEAVQMNQDLSAQAFTHGQDIYFGAGKAPNNDALTAHELTHVIQQNGAIAHSNEDGKVISAKK
ncbi:MAG: DUF4157 domain-containing protein [Leptolyngbyaceae cyanobacterium bins.349]|nr:DUF4157 domain-containing protein [Leptolyngbyaceae cyanobacterium bins.349]